MQNSLKHHARKRFGQNFLQDLRVIDRIIHSITPKTEDKLIEIGPGMGALTAPLLKACPNLQAIEIDRDLIPGLLVQFAKYPSFKIHREDALTFDFSKLTNQKTLRIVGNLPYNISTPLIFHLLSFQHLIRDMHFMLQHEVAERLTAKPGNKHHGRLSLMVQYYCQIDYLFAVPPECFIPKPKVNSAIVRMIPYQTLPHPADNYEHLKQLISTVFQQRRKTLSNSLKPLLSKDLIEKLPIDLRLRPENLSLEDYVKLSNFITHALNRLHSQ